MTDRVSKKGGAGRWIAIAMAIALLMGPGPGMLLVNDTGSLSVGGIQVPYLYAWGLLWYAVEAALVIAACLFVWRDDDE